MKILNRRRVESADIQNLNNDEAVKATLRKERKKAFSALDIYEKNVLRNREYETEEMRAEIEAWWKACCDLHNLDKAKEAIFNPPSAVKKYLEA